MSAENNRDPWGRSLMATLRRWWWVPVALGLVGAVVGGLAGLSTPRSAETLVRVQTSNPDPQAVSDAVQSALLEASSREVYQAAAQKIGVDVATLREKAEVTAVVKTPFLSVKATDRDPAAAAREANALADAAVEASNARVTDQLTQLTRTTSSLIKQQPLPQADAEQARVAQLGQQLASQQSDALTQSRSLSILQSADAATTERTSTALLAGMGLLGGALAGLALALVFGGRRGRIGSLEEVRRVYRDLDVVPVAELPTYLSLEAADVDRVVLSGVRTPAGAVRDLVDPIAAGFHAAGRDVAVTEDVAALAHTAGAGRPHTATLVQSPLSGAVVKRIARDEHGMLVVAVRPNQTRFEWLDEYVDQFGKRVCVVVDR